MLAGMTEQTLRRVLADRRVHVAAGGLANALIYLAEVMGVISDEVSSALHGVLAAAALLIVAMLSATTTPGAAA